MYEEISYVAYHFHWGHEEIVDLTHLMRRRYVHEIAEINRRRNEGN